MLEYFFPTHKIIFFPFQNFFTESASKYHRAVATE